MDKKEIADQIAKLQAELATAPDAQPIQTPVTPATPDEPQPSDVVMGTTGVTSDKEQAINVAVQTASALAGKFIHSSNAVNTLAQVTGMAPVFVHLGLFFASLFHHHAQTQGFVQPQQ